MPAVDSFAASLSPLWICQVQGNAAGALSGPPDLRGAIARSNRFVADQWARMVKNVD